MLDQIKEALAGLNLEEIFNKVVEFINGIIEKLTGNAQ